MRGEDILNTVVLLKPSDDDSGDGMTRFDLMLTKKHGVTGRAATSLSAK